MNSHALSGVINVERKNIFNLFYFYIHIFIREKYIKYNILKLILNTFLIIAIKSN